LALTWLFSLAVREEDRYSAEMPFELNDLHWSCIKLMSGQITNASPPRATVHRQTTTFGEVRSGNLRLGIIRTTASHDKMKLTYTSPSLPSHVASLLHLLRRESKGGVGTE